MEGDFKPRRNRVGGVGVKWTMHRSVWFVVAALALSATACASPLPTTTPEQPTPSVSTSPPVSTSAPGEIALACDDPLPGHCLQLVAYAWRQLPAGVGPLSAVTATSINLCPSASPCIGPPHRGESWVTFTFRDGSVPLGEWIVEMMGIASVQSLRPNVTPPPSTEPATAIFPIGCKGGLSDGDCIGAAAGATGAAPPKPLRTVTVTPPPPQATCPPGARCAAMVNAAAQVSFLFADGSDLTIAVGRDTTNANGWSPLPTQAP